MSTEEAVVEGKEVESGVEEAVTEVSAEEVEAKPEEAVKEMTPEEKTASQRAALLADMMVSFRQDLEGIGMSMDRLAVNKQFWQRRAGETKGSDEQSYKKAEDSLAAIEKQVADLKLAVKETKNFMGFLDEAMSGKLEINYEGA